MKKIYLLPIIILIWCNPSWSQCPATVTISGVYATLYTGSNSWIATSGSTTIPTSSDVTLDANPFTNGYVLLDVGFETNPNSTFLAIVQTPCALLGVNSNELAGILKIFPNPAKSILNIEAKSTINKVIITDLNGRIISKENYNSDTISFNIEQLSNGIYLVKTETENGLSIQKIIKD
jgi:hypothetical protein